VFGEFARPNYNNVTATFIDHVLNGSKPQINAAGAVELIHAGQVAERAIEAALEDGAGEVVLSGKRISVPDLFEKLTTAHELYQQGVFPNLQDPFTRDLFNAYRVARGSDGWRRPLNKHSDHRGYLFETVKGGGGGQTFISHTEPGITRGQHFHLRKVERFLVLEGEAVIRLRRVLHKPVVEYRVSGREPTAIDIPVLHTHSIENIGSSPLLTLFWTHEVFDPTDTDTFADVV
jgi:UDP-2-acetamido-2,6-beta-L-arabino-hexul-4-ose reductase